VQAVQPEKILEQEELLLESVGRHLLAATGGLNAGGGLNAAGVRTSGGCVSLISLNKTL